MDISSGNERVVIPDQNKIANEIVERAQQIYSLKKVNVPSPAPINIPVIKKVPTKMAVWIHILLASIVIFIISFLIFFFVYPLWMQKDGNNDVGYKISKCLAISIAFALCFIMVFAVSGTLLVKAKENAAEFTTKSPLLQYLGVQKD